jgi:hypothetical protein
MLKQNVGAYSADQYWSLLINKPCQIIFSTYRSRNGNDGMLVPYSRVVGSGA